MYVCVVVVWVLNTLRPIVVASLCSVAPHPVEYDEKHLFIQGAFTASVGPYRALTSYLTSYLTGCADVHKSYAVR